MLHSIGTDSKEENMQFALSVLILYPLIVSGLKKNASLKMVV